MQTGMYCKTETITPAMAQAWLATKGKPFRNIDKQRVRSYIAEMEAGRWAATPDAIWLASDGSVVNGRHRLLAIVEVSAPVEMIVWRNVPQEFGRKTDNVRVRTGGQYLKEDGHRHVGTAASIARALMLADDPGRTVFAAEAVSTYAESRPEVFAAAALGVKLHREGLPSATGLGLALYPHLRNKNLEKFTDGLASGAGLAADSPILHVRTLLLSSSMGKNYKQVWAAVASAYAAWANGEQWTRAKCRSAWIRWLVDFDRIRTGAP